MEVDGGGGGVGAGELASPSVSSASAQLELMCRVAETHMNSQAKFRQLYIVARGPLDPHHT